MDIIVKKNCDSCKFRQYRINESRTRSAKECRHPALTYPENQLSFVDTKVDTLLKCPYRDNKNES